MSRTDFTDLVQQLSRKLYRYAFRILCNQEEAEDAVQEVFIKLWKMGPRLDEYKSIDALATAMTKNYCIDQTRKYKLLHQDGPDRADHLSFPSPHEQMEIKESDEIIHNIIGKMDDQYSSLVRLREIEGLSYEEISEKTGQNINTLRVTLSRARKIIRDEYLKYQYERRGVTQSTRKVL